MLALFLSPQAEQDLEDIFEYTVREWSLTQAKKYQDSLFSHLNFACANPTIGAVYPYNKIEYRKLNANKHLVFYRVEKKHCVVIRILHERMNYNEHL